MGKNQNYDKAIEKFSINSPERNYWIGFLLADGCIFPYIDNNGIKTRKTAIQLCLKADDIGHIEKYKNYFGLNNKKITTKFSKAITTSDKYFKSCNIVIYSDIIGNILISYGIVPRKSYIAKVDERLKFDINFWRGVIDGDGSIGFGGGFNKWPRIRLCGTKEVVESFIEFCNKHVNSKINATKKQNIYNCYVSGYAAIDLGNILYKDSTIYLDRKFEIINQFNEFNISMLKDEPMGKLSRTKGKSGERKLVNEIKLAFPNIENVRRGWQARNGADDSDVITPGVWWESKFAKKPNIEKALQQAIEESEKNGEGKLPIAVIRYSGYSGDPRAYLRLDDLFKLIKDGKNILKLND